MRTFQNLQLLTKKETQLNSTVHWNLNLKIIITISLKKTYGWIAFTQSKQNFNNTTELIWLEILHNYPLKSRLPDTIFKEKFNTSCRISLGGDLQNCTIINQASQNSCYVLCIINSKMVTSYQWHMKLPHHCHHTRGLTRKWKYNKIFQI